MCITKECKNPTEPGVWWREDDRWIKYSPDQATNIKLAKANGKSTFHLGRIKSVRHPSGHKYKINLTSMEQVNCHSTYRRQVLIVYKEGEEVKICEPPTPTLGTVYLGNVYLTDLQGAMRALGPAETTKVLVAAAGGKTKVSVESDVVVDLVSLRATEYGQGWCFGAKAVKSYQVSIDCPWNPEVTKANMDKKKTLQEKVLGGIVKGVYKHVQLEDTVFEKHVKTLARLTEGDENKADELVTALTEGKLDIVKALLDTQSVV